MTELKNPEPCEWVLAHYAFGAQTCGVLGTKIVVDFSGQEGHVCNEHYDVIMSQRDGASS